MYNHPNPDLLTQLITRWCELPLASAYRWRIRHADGTDPAILLVEMSEDLRQDLLTLLIRQSEFESQVSDLQILVAEQSATLRGLREHLQEEQTRAAAEIAQRDRLIAKLSRQMIGETDAHRIPPDA
jgi:hypothetical protein